LETLILVMLLIVFFALLSHGHLLSETRNEQVNAGPTDPQAPPRQPNTEALKLLIDERKNSLDAALKIDQWIDQVLTVVAGSGLAGSVTIVWSTASRHSEQLTTLVHPELLEQIWPAFGLGLVFIVASGYCSRWALDAKMKDISDISLGKPSQKRHVGWNHSALVLEAISVACILFGSYWLFVFAKSNLPGHENLNKTVHETKQKLEVNHVKR
jgi:hypothetical protein